MKWLVFADLVAAGVCNNWQTLNRRIAKEGFPPGRLVGRRRVWIEAEILRWYETQPTGKAPLKGRAKRLAANLQIKQPLISSLTAEDDSAGVIPSTNKIATSGQPFSALASKRV